MKSSLWYDKEVSITTNMELVLHGLNVITLKQYIQMNLYKLPSQKKRRSNVLHETENDIMDDE
jgi:hypothetical protein